MVEKRSVGRPRKYPPPDPDAPKRPRGRPRKDREKDYEIEKILYMNDEQFDYATKQVNYDLDEEYDENEYDAEYDYDMNDEDDNSDDHSSEVSNMLNNIAEKDAQEIKCGPKQLGLREYYDSIKELAWENFSVVPNDNDKSLCQICNTQQRGCNFFKSYSMADIGHLNPNGERHLGICKKCSKKLFAYYYNLHNKDMKLSFNHWCQSLNLYYDDEILKFMINARKNRKEAGTSERIDIVTEYMTSLAKSRKIDYTYWNSPYLKNEIENDVDSEGFDLSYIDNDDKDYPVEFADWSQEDLDNYDQIVEWYKYDPFEDEPISDRRKLYHNLVGFSDPEIADDTGRANACIDMCRSIQRLEKLNKKRIQMENNKDSSIKEIKMIAELQEKERKGIQQYQKEWGFNARYSLTKAQGVGTLTGTLKQMDDAMFEDALVNAYDIKTSNAMQAAAEASWKAIFSQLNISESEFSEIVKNQRETIMELRNELDEVKEKLRLANVEVKRCELEKQVDPSIRMVH